MPQERNERHINEEEGAESNDPLLHSRGSRNSTSQSWQQLFDYKVVRNALRVLFALSLLTILTLLLAFWFRGNTFASGPISATPITRQEFKDSWRKCQVIEKKNNLRKQFYQQHLKETETESKRTTNPRSVNGTRPVVFKSVTVWDGIGKEYRADVLLKDGIIAQIGKYIRIPKQAIVINGKDKILTPGLVDMHSHIGVANLPVLDENDDSNEMTQPVYPQLRTLDAFNPSDKAIPRTLSGGVTTVLVLPGSGNVNGGEAFVMKLRPIANMSVESHLIDAGSEEDKHGFHWRYMKFACGENPKRVYAEQGKTPTTRMGSAYILRKKFDEAMQLVKKQDRWCNYLADTFSDHELRSDSKSTTLVEPFPEVLELESISELIRGNTEDIETMVRISEEFKFQIWAFHHALEAYRIPEIIKRAGRNGFKVTIATFSDGWGYKKEAFEASPIAPLILSNHKIPVALKSDHPVINSQFLMFEAVKAFHSGLDPALALASVTSIPAKALGQSHRIGSIKVGLDADVALWETDPLSVGARPVQVFVDGIPQFNHPDTDPDVDQKVEVTEYEEPVHFPVGPNPKPEDSIACPTSTTNTFILKGFSKILVRQSNNTKPLQFSSVQDKPDLRLIVQNGKVTCAGHDCHSKIKTLRNEDSELPEIDLGGRAWMIPGLVGVNTKLGLKEIAQESSTGDGSVKDVDPFKVEAYPFAKDGIRFGGKHLDRAFKGGVTAAVTAPLLSEGVIGGYGTAFFTDGTTAYDQQDSLKEVTSLHVAVGHDFKSKGSANTISGQFSLLRRALIAAIDARSNNLVRDNTPMAKVLKGEIPLVAEAQSADDITRLILLRNQIRKTYKLAGGFGAGLDLIIIGGAESWKVADQLANEQVPVILQPARCTIESWSTRNCLPGPPLTADTTFTVLHRAGVKVGFAPDSDAEFVRDLIWEASWAYASSQGNLTEIDAIGLVTWNLDSMFHLGDVDEDSQNGAEDLASYLFFDESPLSINSTILLTWSANRGLQCLSKDV